MPLISRFHTVLLPALAFTALVALVAAPRAAHAQANLTFTGGSGSPFSLTLAAPVTYIITTSSPAGTQGGPYFIFDSAGGFFDTFSPVTSSITFNVNGGSAQTLTTINTLFNVDQNDVTADDLYTFGSLPALTAGDILTLTSGTLTTTNDVAGAPPANGSFTTFIANGAGIRISTDGLASVTAPEPGSLALLLPVVGIAGMVIRKRRKK